MACGKAPVVYDGSNEESALALIFHPYFSDTFAMRCEGIVTLHGIRSWQIYFPEKKDKPNMAKQNQQRSNHYS